MTSPRTRGSRRGRPTVFEEPVRTRYLSLLRDGARLGEAADVLGISRVVPARYAKTDRTFNTAMAEAREEGAKVRRENVPHGEYRYNILGCRCPDCGLAARVGRTARRADTAATEEPPAEPAGDVHPIRLERPGVESLPSFLLARAS